MTYTLSDFDYTFDPSLIAQYPLPERDSSRLLVLDRKHNRIEHRRFYEIGEYLREGDMLIVNNTRVIPCRLIGKKEHTGGMTELLLIKRIEEDVWEVMLKGRAKKGNKIIFSSSLNCDVQDRRDARKDEYTIVKFNYYGDWDTILSETANIPIPPYIRRKPVEGDKEWYQTVFALYKGSIAAPTAGLHFTEKLLFDLKSKGIIIAAVTLHVGVGTFKPVNVESIDDHKMHPEYFDVSKELADTIRRVKANGGRIIAVGTTSVRALEHAAISGEVMAGKGETGIFIHPGFKFNVIDAMVTNFHLPKSTLLMLVMALAGREGILTAYSEAVSLRYRFYSYGDAMLIL
ncbi:MAG: tRNA preQ1(34) S-adenosylmethionine ribosyltransferase-isomerase QueA [Nitrospirae bacterium]|nr:tRNA preQ1(34) S-adenosylmethionine ribosyltransferase-isomerase QueA [Nitrospirota bacterium]